MNDFGNIYMKFGNEYWLILFWEYINPKLFAVHEFTLWESELLPNPYIPSCLDNSSCFFIHKIRYSFAAHFHSLPNHSFLSCDISNSFHSCTFLGEAAGCAHTLLIVLKRDLSKAGCLKGPAVKITRSCLTFFLY